MRHLIDLVESVFDYSILSPDELKSIATSEDDNSDGEIEADDCEWSYDPAFPLARLHDCMPEGNWAGWMKDEIELDNVEELGRDWADLQNEDILSPIIIATNGEMFQIWNGWHRTAGQIVRGAKTIPAVVGIVRA